MRLRWDEARVDAEMDDEDQGPGLGFRAVWGLSSAFFLRVRVMFHIGFV